MQVSRCWYVDQSTEKLWKKRHVHAILEITWNAHESLEVKVLESHGQTKQWWQWPTVREECSFQLRPPVKLWYVLFFDNFLHAASSKVAKRIQNLSESFLRIGKSYWQSLILLHFQIWRIGDVVTRATAANSSLFLKHPYKNLVVDDPGIWSSSNR